MDSSKCSKFHSLGGSLARRVFFRALFLASAISIVSLLRFLPTIDLESLAPKTYEDCIEGGSNSENATVSPGSYLFQSRVLNTFWGSLDSLNCKKDFNLISGVVTELMGKRLLDFAAKSLCIGEEGSSSNIAVSAMQQLGFSNVTKHRFFFYNKKKIACSTLEYKDSSFDFVLSKDLDKIVPSLLVLEVERILKPGGIGAVLIVGSDSDSDSDSDSVSVSSLLRSSSIVHVGHVDDHNLLVFKKRSQNTSSLLFYHNSLPEDCASVKFTKPLIKLIEPLVEERPNFEHEIKRISYLPKLIEVSNEKKKMKHLVYVNIGVGEVELNNNTGFSVSDWFPHSYPIDHKAFSVYFVHYNTSILLSYVKRPRVTFVYHPGLLGGKVGVEEFDFLAWFKETVQHADFVVLKINNAAGRVEMKILSDMYESGAICFVDELFLSCSESETVSCMDIFRGLRSNGVYVHQWWGSTKLSYAR